MSFSSLRLITLWCSRASSSTEQVSPLLLNFSALCFKTLLIPFITTAARTKTLQRPGPGVPGGPEGPGGPGVPGSPGGPGTSTKAKGAR